MERYGHLYGAWVNNPVIPTMNTMESYVMKEMLGKSMFAVVRRDESVVMYCEDGRIYTLVHQQDCCECVVLYDVCGDLTDLVGSPLFVAEVVSNKDDNPDYESATWTFYKFATIKGYVTMSWHGSSNGYYSEDVDLVVDQENTSEWRDMRLEVLGIE